MDKDTQQSLLSSIKLMKELTDLIICMSHHPHAYNELLRLYPTLHVSNNLAGEARAIFVPSGETSNTNSPPIYNVVTSKRSDPYCPEYDAYLILYTTPALAAWKMLMVNPSFCLSPVDAMADLLEALYGRAHSTRVTLCEMNREKRRERRVTGNVGLAIANCGIDEMYEGDVYTGEQEIV
jgi:hypothetical protein